jgi:hypothetical protein
MGDARLSPFLIFHLGQKFGDIPTYDAARRDIIEAFLDQGFQYAKLLAFFARALKRQVPHLVGTGSKRTKGFVIRHVS